LHCHPLHFLEFDHHIRHHHIGNSYLDLHPERNLSYLCRYTPITTYSCVTIHISIDHIQHLNRHLQHFHFNQMHRRSSIVVLHFHLHY